ncbi:MAG: hypothetical protein COY66_00410 [Candidatus Kerfeldbacteria bacterium CG_4_10_14_0_8_um_filter_42_10]|uniref:Uncharacterized protein n=1 Tax=Candidatus Kerfeldbacteria bacterium CG_4_10_14_0_8_um_filter_42_10 TaxID=2014248 RepID=A0A2M7RKJ6_9BACT|nr:MAG: hypothetical protein COY66_00410 [Candidatus Kerfeldbacteria bacterium CG_4_10_14_0_8_um_filter_42_10]
MLIGSFANPLWAEQPDQAIPPEELFQQIEASRQQTTHWGNCDVPYYFSTRRGGNVGSITWKEIKHFLRDSTVDVHMLIVSRGTQAWVKNLVNQKAPLVYLDLKDSRYQLLWPSLYGRGTNYRNFKIEGVQVSAWAGDRPEHGGVNYVVMKNGTVYPAHYEGSNFIVESSPVPQ